MCFLYSSSFLLWTWFEIGMTNLISRMDHFIFCTFCTYQVVSPCGPRKHLRFEEVWSCDMKNWHVDQIYFPWLKYVEGIFWDGSNLIPFSFSYIQICAVNEAILQHPLKVLDRAAIRVVLDVWTSEKHGHRQMIFDWRTDFWGSNCRKSRRTVLWSSQYFGLGPEKYFVFIAKHICKHLVDFVNRLPQENCKGWALDDSQAERLHQ